MINVHGIVPIGIEGRIIPIRIERIAFERLEVGAFPDSAAREARVRIYAALAEAVPEVSLGGFRVTIDPKLIQGASIHGLDLPIALGCLALMGVVPTEVMERVIAFGELSLRGVLRPQRGVYPCLTAIHDARKVAVLPLACEAETWDPEHTPPFLAVETLTDLIAKLHEPLPTSAGSVQEPSDVAWEHQDMRDIPADHPARRPLEVAAAGNVGVLFTGWAGSGATMLARRFTGILPPMTPKETRMLTRIYSVSGLIPTGGGAVVQRPFRAPHHTVSEMGLLGSGQPVRPGEVTLAHHGVLYLDEATEFQAKALDALAVARGQGSVQVLRGLASPLPAAPIIMASIMPCPCGNPRTCECRDHRITAYRQRLGTLLPFMPVRIRVGPPTWQFGTEPTPSGEDSATIRARVAGARALAAGRKPGAKPLEGSDWKPPRGVRNGDLVAIARILADLEQSAAIRPHHGDEACSMFQDFTAAPRSYAAEQR